MMTSFELLVRLGAPIEEQVEAWGQEPDQPVSVKVYSYLLENHYIDRRRNTIPFMVGAVILQPYFNGKPVIIDWNLKSYF
jgi:hypothetical protein